MAPTGWVGQRWYYLAFVFPVAMEFLVDARELNEPGPRRAVRVLLTLAISVFLLTVVGWSLLSGWLDPEIPLQESVFAFSRGIPLRFYLLAFVAAVVAGAMEKGRDKAPLDSQGVL